MFPTVSRQQSQRRYPLALVYTVNDHLSSQKNSTKSTMVNPMQTIAVVSIRAIVSLVFPVILFRTWANNRASSLKICNIKHTPATLGLPLPATAN